MGNWFDSEKVAARYRRARPAFHHHVIDRIRSLLSPLLPLDRSLDVGCGVGASTRALAELSKEVVGIDPALPMIRRAGRPGEYLAARGEELPFREDAFDLLTVSQVFHWMDPTSFLAEAKRVLRPEGKLIIYDNYFAAPVFEAQGFEDWMYETCLVRYPAPPRGAVEFHTGETAGGFRCVVREEYENTFSFTQHALIDFLLTQSNVIAAITEGVTTQVRMKEWLAAEMKPFFGDDVLTVRFRGPIWMFSLQ